MREMSPRTFVVAGIVSAVATIATLAPLTHFDSAGGAAIGTSDTHVMATAADGVEIVIGGRAVFMTYNGQNAGVVAITPAGCVGIETLGIVGPWAAPLASGECDI